MDITMVDDGINKLIGSEVGMHDSIGLIKEELVTAGVPDNLIEAVKIDEIYQEYSSWLISLLKERPLPSEIKALNFGLFESTAGVQLYTSGSTEWDKDDWDWACNNDYFPDERYAPTRLYSVISPVFEFYELSGVYLALALTVICTKNFFVHIPM